MSGYFEEGSLYQLSPVRVKLESPETDRGESEDEMRVKDEEGEAVETASGRAGGGSGGLPFNVVVVHPSVVETGYSHHDNSSSAQPCPAEQAPKKRRMRFSEVEGHVVLTQVAERWDELHGQKSKFLYRGGKKQIWNDIARLVTAKSRRVRSGEDVRKKWTSEKKLLKEKGAGLLRARACGAGGPGGQFTALEQRLWSLMCSTFGGGADRAEACMVGGLDVPEIGFEETSPMQTLPDPPQREVEEGGGEEVSSLTDSDDLPLRTPLPGAGTGTSRAPWRPAPPPPAPHPPPAPSSIAQAAAGTPRRLGRPPLPTLEPLVRKVLERQEEILGANRTHTQLLGRVDRSLQAIAHSLASLAATHSSYVNFMMARSHGQNQNHSQQQGQSSQHGFPGVSVNVNVSGGAGRGPPQTQGAVLHRGGLFSSKDSELPDL
ncbi:myb-related mRNAion factor [Huso huso]|uniref:Myb-related mRNAion factor n=1 Tax=Huso huso TaxID=61971 RepID=A0ABR0YBQ3_HUSHU